jgi:hydroxymethylbilane synthase
LTRLLPNARFTAIRGNLDTRLRKLDEGQHDALVLAAAGLKRLGFGSRIALALPPAAVSAGTRSRYRRHEIRDGRLERCCGQLWRTIDDGGWATALTAERRGRRGARRRCQTPVGALATEGG